MLPRAPLPWAALLAILALGARARADLPPAAPKAVNFRADVYPLLSRCLRCHKGSNPVSSVRLDRRSELLGASNGRPLVEVGSGARSRLIHLVAGHVPDKVMPPEGRGKRLTSAEVGILRAWVDQGLAWDEKLLPPAPVPGHWAFRPLGKPAIPQVKRAAWPLTPVDAFIAAKHEAAGLLPTAEAPRRTLIRRLALDLLGLPPTLEEIDAFVADARPDAYERLVERLLASPDYGVRWGRHWLDVARWAESEGYESNHLRTAAWRYRDYVVNSFNRDEPFAQFVRRQVAGDEMRPYRDENLIATGFLAAARLSSNEEDRRRQRNDVLVDIVNATSAAFLGLTFNCAQCHNHKFDPLTARDYYRFMGFFVKGQPGNLELREPALRAAYEAARPPWYEAARKERLALFAGSRARLVAAAKKALSSEMTRALAIPEARRTPAEDQLARDAERKLQFGTTATEKGLLAAEAVRYRELGKRLAEAEKHIPDRPQTFGFYAPATAAAKVEVLPMKGFYPPPFDAARLASSRAYLLVGGDVHRRGPALEPGWPALFGPTPAAPAPRLALADWLTSPGNPLTARVWVNRIWHYHFGRGIVATPNDFGVKGAPPSHPELLDWLAQEFLRSGGSTKHLHRLIVGSRTYRQGSTPHAGNAKIDPNNALLWRWSPRRVEAEVVRDASLFVSGELERRLGGPSDIEEKKSLRRALYLLQQRDKPSAVQGLFDGPSGTTESCPRRSVSTTPLAALFLFNNEFPVARARALAERARARAGAERERQVSECFRLLLGRGPSPDELTKSLSFFGQLPGAEKDKLALFCQVVLNLNEFLYVE